MANNTTLNPGTGGDLIQTYDNTGTVGAKTQAVALVNSTGATAVGVTTTNELLVRENMQTATGSLGALNAAVDFTGALNSAGTVGISISGTWVGTVSFFGSIDDVTYFAINAIPISGGALVTTTTANGEWQVDCSGFKDVQVKMTSYTSGTATITMVSSDSASLISLDGPLPTGSNVIGGVTQSGTWTVATNADGTIGAGTAASKALAVGGIYNSSRITLTNGQGSALQLDADGSQYVNVADWTVASTTVLGKVTIDQTTPGTTNLVATNADAAIAAGTAPSKALAQAGVARVGANPTKATNGQTIGVATDAIGRVITTPGHERTMVGMQQTTITSSTAETTIVTAIASTFCDLTHLSITNGSATATIVTLKDSTAGTTRAIYNLGAGGGIEIDFTVPLPQATANNNWTITCGTSVASVYVNAVYLKNA